MRLRLRRRRADRATEPPVVLVSTVGTAQGAPGAAAALACAASAAHIAPVLVDMRGGNPRPTLLGSDSAQEMDDVLKAQLASVRSAVRGNVCFVGANPDREGWATAAAAIAIAQSRRSPSVALVDPQDARTALSVFPPVTGVLLRAGPDAIPELERVAGDLRKRDIRVEVLNARLPWVPERRAQFGSLGPSAPDGLKPELLHRLLGRWFDPEPRVDP